MQILDGKLVAGLLKKDLKNRVAKLILEKQKVPHLAAILVGQNGASETYVASKVKSCEEIGYYSTLFRYPGSISESELLTKIEILNDDINIDGILVQLPLPDHISEEKIFKLIKPSKDVDGFHPLNVGRLVQGMETFVSATPYGIMLLLEHYKIPTSGMNAVVIGRSNIVGRPVSILLSMNAYPGNCTVTLCHSRTKDLAGLCRNADLIIAALGSPGFLKAEMIKEGSIVIDVGITRVTDNTRKNGYRLSGDVDFENVAPKCSYITPVPGGIGPMTIAGLLMNTYKACIGHKNQIN